MKLSSVVNVSMGVSMCCCAHLATDYSPRQPVSSSIAVTVEILQKDAEGKDVTKCAGVWLSEDIVVTDEHCTFEQDEDGNVTALTELRLSMDPQHMEEVYTGTVLSREHGTDLALLRVFNARPHPWAPLAAHNPDVGTHVHVVGHPAAFAWTYLEGVVSQERSSVWGENRPYTQIQVPMTHGSSGGGAFNDAGELVGLADCMTDSLPSEGFFNTVEEIRHIVRVTGVKLP